MAEQEDVLAGVRKVNAIRDAGITKGRIAGLRAAARSFRKLERATDPVSCRIKNSLAGVSAREVDAEANALRRAARGTLLHAARWCEAEARRLEKEARRG